MRLIRLKITDDNGFRSLQKDFEAFFLRDFDYKHVNEFNPNILAGRNGSGKSNILEALANIFYHLNCIYADNLPDNFSKKTTIRQDKEAKVMLSEEAKVMLSEEAKVMLSEEAEEEEDNDDDYVFDNTIGVVDAYELEYFTPLPLSMIEKAAKNVSSTSFNHVKAHILIAKKKVLSRQLYGRTERIFLTKQMSLVKRKFSYYYPNMFWGTHPERMSS